jgi:hypothetical protein
MEMLPPELKALIKVKLPKPKGLPDLSKFNLTAIAQELNATLPAALQNVSRPRPPARTHAWVPPRGALRARVGALARVPCLCLAGGGSQDVSLKSDAVAWLG